MHFRARAYDPRLGRFIQTDPVIENRVAEHYVYAANDPIRKADPTGMLWWWDWQVKEWKWLDMGDGVTQTTHAFTDEIAKGYFNPEVLGQSNIVWIIPPGGLSARPITWLEQKQLVETGLFGKTSELAKSSMFSESEESLHAKYWTIQILKAYMELYAGIVTAIPDAIGAGIALRQFARAGVKVGLSQTGRAGLRTGTSQVDDFRLITLPRDTVPVPLGGPMLTPGGRAGITPGVDDLSRAASVLDRKGFTVAGRSLTKHGVGARSGNMLLPAAKGNPPAINQQAQDIVDDILTTPGTIIRRQSHAKYGEVIDFIAPDGRGIRYSSAGKFIYFKEVK